MRKVTLLEVEAGLTGLLATKEEYAKARDMNTLLKKAMRGDKEGLLGACNLSYTQGQIDLLKTILEGLSKEWPLVGNPPAFTIS